MSDRSSTRKHKQRVVAACDFCRKRKLGCDNKKPKCTKCIAFNRECTYAERQSSERPSNSRIAQLSEENALLKACLEKVQAVQSAEPGVFASAQRPTTSSHGAEANIHSSPIYQNIVKLATAFHGPSSALHDITFSTSAPAPDSSSAEHAVSKSELFAEASRQRQLESINLKAGRLDFQCTNPAMGYTMLQAFWNRQHHSGGAVYRPAFMRDMASNGPHFTTALLNTILFVASRYAPDQTASDACASGMVFRTRAEESLHQFPTMLLTRSKLTTVQTLLLVVDELFTWCDERSLSWHYLGIAINMIVDLGMHTLSSSFYQKSSIEDQEIGRRVFWSAYVADKIQSIYQGRPPRLRDADCSIPRLFLDEYEELEPFNTVTYNATAQQLDTPTRSVSTKRELCRLSIIAESILATLYAETAHHKDAGALLEAAASLQGELESWRDSLPIHLSLQWHKLSAFDILPHTLALHAMDRSLEILLCRPFVSEGHLRVYSDSTTRSAFVRCMAAAVDIDRLLRLYKAHFCLRTCPPFIPYATYASGTIHARLAAQQPAGSESSRMLRHCLEVLAEQQEECHAPRQFLKTLLLLAKRLGVDVGTGVKASRSRTDDDDDPQILVSEVGPVSRDVDLQDFDWAAIASSFALGPQSHASIGFPTPEVSTAIDNVAESSIGTGTLHDTDTAWNPSEVDFDTFLTANIDGTELSLDSLFGFDTIKV